MRKEPEYDCIIIGAGIVGLTIAHEFTERYPNKSMLIIDKEKSFFFHQSGRNSGVIHSGIYYKPNSLKADLCIKGYKLLLRFAKKNKIPFEITGKIITAYNAEEHRILKLLKKNGEKNGLTGLKLIDFDEFETFNSQIKYFEKALFVPQTGIIDYVDVGNSLCNILKNRGVEFIYDNTLINYLQNKSSVLVNTEKIKCKTKKLFLCLGVNSDIFLPENEKKKYRVFPFKGEYFTIKSSVNFQNVPLIYPCPNLDLPFLGVHITKTINGQLEAGPNAILSLSRSNYNKLAFNLKDFIKIITWKGFWRFVLKYWKIGIIELIRSYFKYKFRLSIRRFLNLNKGDSLEKRIPGIRAQLMNVNGDLVDDFKIIKDDKVINILNAPSPAATSSFALAKKILNTIE